MHQRTIEMINTNAKLARQLDRMELLVGIIRTMGERQDLVSIFMAVLQNLENDVSIDWSMILIRTPGITGNRSPLRCGFNRFRHAPHGWPSGGDSYQTVETGHTDHSLNPSMMWNN